MLSTSLQPIVSWARDFVFNKNPEFYYNHQHHDCNSISFPNKAFSNPVSVLFYTLFLPPFSNLVWSLFYSIPTCLLFYRQNCAPGNYLLTAPSTQSYRPLLCTIPTKHHQWQYRRSTAKSTARRLFGAHAILGLARDNVRLSRVRFVCLPPLVRPPTARSRKDYHHPSAPLTRRTPSAAERIEDVYP